MIFADKDIKNKNDGLGNNENNQGSKNILATVGMFFLELVKVAFLAGITVGLVRYFIFKPFYVEGQSMEPTYLGSEYLIIDEISYRFREPERGEVIVLRAPTVEKEYFLKRIIGLPGDHIWVENNKVIISNSQRPDRVLLEEKYLVEPTPGSANYTLGLDEYFVMGDNRDASFDSRRFGPIKRNGIIGRTWFRGWPLNRITLFEPPVYNL